MRRTPPKDSDGEARRLLKRCGCPMPFHAVRAFILGSIACPRIETRPLQVLEAMWGGEMPEFESLDDANELVGVLMNGLWNRLTRHQSRKHPYRLTILPPPADQESIRQFAETRVAELQELSIIAAKEINKTVLSCARARRASLETMRPDVPTRH